MQENRKQKQEILIEKDEGNDREFSDILDGLKDGMRVHGKTDYHLDENFVWCKKPDEKWTNFHTRQHIVAKKIERSFPPLKAIKYGEDGKPQYDSEGHYQYEELPNPLARKAFLLVMMPSNDWAILNRNDMENVVLNGILKWGDSAKDIIPTKDMEAPGVKSMPKKITQFFKKKKKEEVIMGE